MNIGDPGLAPSQSSGGSRAANVDGAPRKHGVSHSSREPARKAPTQTSVILWLSSFEARRRGLAPQDDGTIPSFGNASGAAANIARARALSSFIWATSAS